MTEQDLLLDDVAGIVQVQQGKLDLKYLRHWAGQLGLAAELETALSGVRRPKHT